MKDRVIQKVNTELSQVFNDKNLTSEQRGEKGEVLILELVKYWSSRYEGSFIKDSFIFPQSPNLPTTGTVEEEPVTEIDILLVTPYRIFVIEVKTIYGNMRVYRDHNIEIIRKGKFQEQFESKNYFRQNEMHCRHLYYHLQGLLPDGNPDYIQPLIVMTGKMKFEDLRSNPAKVKYPLFITNKLIPMLIKYNEPNQCLLDLKRINRKLNSLQVFDKQRLLNSQVFKNNRNT